MLLKQCVSASLPNSATTHALLRYSVNKLVCEWLSCALMYVLKTKIPTLFLYMYPSHHL